MHRILKFQTSLVAIAMLSMLISTDSSADEVGGDGPNRVTLDFSSAGQLDQMAEVLNTAEARYPHADDPGVGGTPGLMRSNNVGEQGDAIFYTARPINLRAGQATASVMFRAAEPSGNDGPSRIVLALGSKKNVNLASGEPKFGLRVFKDGKGENAENPWRLQLVNRFGTRNLGQPFTLTPGHWYRLAGDFGTTPDGKQFTFSAMLEDMGGDGKTAGELKRTGSGVTPVHPVHHTIDEMWLGLLGQNNGGGTDAFDNLQLTIGQREASSSSAPPPADLPAMDEVVFLPPPPVAADVKAPAGSMFGMCMHVIHTNLYYDNKSPYWQLEYVMPLLLEANAGWVRGGMYQPWFANVERKDVDRHRADFERYLQMYQDRGINVILPIMAVSPGDQWEKYNQPFFEYTADLVKRFDCIKVVEMHNEPNLKFFWRATAEDYVATYEPAAAMIKEARPDVEIAVGSISSLWWGPGVEWFDRAIAAGVLDWADAIAIHPYNRSLPPESDPHWTGGDPSDPDHRDKAFDAWWQHIQSQYAEADRLKVYFTEVGYSSSNHGIAGTDGESTQADYLSRLMLSFMAAKLRGLPLEAATWYDFKNDGTTDHGEHNFGVIGYDLSHTKEAFTAFRGLAQFFADTDGFSESDVEVTFNNWPQVIKKYTWQRADDEAVVVPFWRLAHLQGPGRDADFASVASVTLPAGFQAGRVELHQLEPGYVVRDTGFVQEGDRLDVPVRLTSRASWFVVIPTHAMSEAK